MRMTASLALVLAAAGTLDAQQRLTRRESHGEVRNRVTISTVVAAIDNSSRVIVRLDDLAGIPPERVRIVDVRPYVPNARRTSYNAALQRNGEKIEDLRAGLVTMDATVKVLAEQRPRLTVDHVVGAGILDVMETGRSVNVLVLYVDNRNNVGRGDARAVGTFRPTATSLFAALDVTPEMVARVSALESVRLDRIRFYNVDTLLSAADTGAFRTALRLNETSIRALRAELSKWPVVVTALQRHEPKMALGDIYAADVIGSGDVLVLYYAKRS